jgi:type I restriction enzyme S subunit
MAKLDDLLQKLCPEGVVFKKLSAVCEDFVVPMRERPKVFNGGTPWCRIEDIQGNFIHGSLSGLGVSASTIKEMNLKVMPTGTVIASCSASLGRYAITTQPLITNQTFIGLVCGPALFNRYLLHWLFTQTSKLTQISNSGTIPYISRALFENLEIPVPPLKIQVLIAETLDAFNELEAELEAELKARRKQYEYYRNQLLSFSEQGGVRWVPMGEVGTFFRGKGMPKSDLQHTGFPAIHYGQLYTEYHVWTEKTKNFIPQELLPTVSIAMKGDLLMAISDVTPLNVGKAVAWVGDSDVAIGGDILAFRHNLDPKYLSYVTETHDFQREKMSKVTGSTVRHISASSLAKIVIPVPQLSVQLKIVGVLDALRALTSDLQAGLPAEILARRTQYEHYRDKLLTFKELKTS